MKKGFTLIELLAVIVVLAFLALVVTPIVLNIVENAQIGSDERSLEAYAKVLQSSYYEEKMKDTTLTLQDYLDNVHALSGTSLAYNGSKVECETKKAKEVDGAQTIELYNCIVDGRGYYNFINGKAEKEKELVTYKIITTLENIALDNNDLTIEEGSNYSSTIILNEGYSIKEVIIKMNGEDITDSVYSNRIINIEKVTGDIEIKLKAEKNTYEVITNLTNVTINSVPIVSYGESFTGKLNSIDLYTLDEVIIKMNGEDITSSVYNNGEITIEKVTGSIEIIATALQTTFTVTNNLTDVTINNNITTIKKGEKYSANLTVDTSYQLGMVIVKMNGEDITSSVYSSGMINIEEVTGNIEVTANSILSQFGSDSWETIVSNVQTGNTSGYKVGDTKYITLSSEDTNIAGTYTVRIANMSTPAECNTEGFSQTACGFVIEFVDEIIRYGINSTRTNVGGWEESEMRKYLNETLYESLPIQIKQNIINTIVVSGHGNTSDEKNFITTDKLYLLSSKEVWGGARYDTATKQTRQLDYYENIGVTTSDNCSLTIKKYKNSKFRWWLRTAERTNITHFSTVYEGDGKESSNIANYNCGVSPAFRIG